MSRKREILDKEKEEIVQSELVQPAVNLDVQNEEPFLGWPNFDIFWAQVVKGKASPTIKSACREHIKALGVWNDQSKWIDALVDFGIQVEE